MSPECPKAEGGEAGTSPGVVDSHLEVLGVKGLGVVDASVFVRSA